jgi:hypothetical protein
VPKLVATRRNQLPGGRNVPKSFLRTVLIAGISILIGLTQGASLALADDDIAELYDATKKEFVDKFEKFKKEGLTAEQVEELTDQLLDLAGDEIEGTGTETLLKTMNQQAKNTVSVLKKKENLEDLIDFVGDLYAIGSSDAPPDPVDAYKALGKGVGLGAKLADKIPVLNMVAVPMMEAYAQAIKNGEGHIEAIDAATKAKNEIIELGWRSPDYSDELLAATEMDEAEDEEPTEEELQWEADRILRQAEYGERLDACRAEYDAYDRAATARSEAWKKLEAQSAVLKQGERSAATKRHAYNDLIPNYKNSHAGLQKALEKRDMEYARMERAKAQGNEQGYQARKAMLQEFERELASRKQTLREDYEKISQRRSRYLEAKAVVARARREYRALRTAYEAIDRDFKQAKAAFDACMESGDAPAPAPSTVSESTRKPARGACTSAAGRWDGGDWGETVFFKEPKGKFAGTYTHDNGRIYGSFQSENVFAGVWVEDEAARKCDTPSPTEDSRKYYWGDFSVRFNEDFSEFTGAWGYCGDSPDRSWEGSRLSVADGPSDAWLGDWWFEVQKACDGYQVQTHTEGPDRTEIVSIGVDRLEFLFNDALGTHIILTRDGDVISGTVQQPNNSGLPRGRVEGKRAAGVPGSDSPR